MPLIVRKDTRKNVKRNNKNNNNIIRYGSGLINNLIDRLGVELHIPGYRFCGPGTRIHERINQQGVNKLDDYCKTHDIAYSNTSDLTARHKADKILEDNAWSRVRSKDSTIAEKISAYLVTNIIKAKRKMGAGLGNRSKKPRRQIKKTGRGVSVKSSNKKGNKVPFKKIIAAARAAMNKNSNPVETSLLGARAAVQNAGGKKHVRIPRVLALPKRIGGFLLPAFVLPLMAALSSVGGLAGGSAAVIKTIADIKNANNQLTEAKRHNKAMEEKKVGAGLYLKPYKQGLGLFIAKNL